MSSLGQLFMGDRQVLVSGALATGSKAINKALLLFLLLAMYITASQAYTGIHSPSSIKPTVVKNSGVAHSKRNLTDFTSTPVTTAAVGTPYSYEITPFDASYEYNLTFGGIDGLDLNKSGSHVYLMGAPLIGGSFDINLSISDGTTTVYQNYELNVSSTSPLPFYFHSIYNTDTSVSYADTNITLKGFLSLPISITGGYYQKNRDGNWTNESGTVTNGDSIDINVTSSSSYSTTTGATLTVGSYSADFNVTTMSASTASTPDVFIFTPVLGADTGTYYESDHVTLSGIKRGSATMICSGACFVNGTPYGGQSVTVANGDVIWTNGFSSASTGQTVSQAVTIGDYNTTFDISTSGGSNSAIFSFVRTVSQKWMMTGQKVMDSSGYIYATMGGAVIKFNPAADTNYTVIAGKKTMGVPSFSQNYNIDGSCSTASFNPMWSSSLTRDSSGNIYIAERDSINSGGLIRKISTDCNVTTIAGSGSYSSVDGNGSSASFAELDSIVAGSDGTVFVLERYGNYNIRKITPSGMVSTIATNLALSNNGATQGSGGNMVMNSTGTLFVASGSKIVKVSQDGNVSTFAGAAMQAYVDGSGSIVRFGSVSAMSIDANDTIYLFDGLYKTVRKVTAAGVTSTIAGKKCKWGMCSVDTNSMNGFGTDGMGLLATFNQASSILPDANGSIYVFDMGGLRKISFVTAANMTPNAFSFTPITNALPNAKLTKSFTVGGLSSLAFITVKGGKYSINGTSFTTVPGAVQSGDVITVQALSPVTFGASSGVTLTIGNRRADFNITTTATPYGPFVTTFAGGGITNTTMTSSSDGSGSGASFSGFAMNSLAIDGSGNIYVADSQCNNTLYCSGTLYNSSIRKISPSGAVTTILNSGFTGTYRISAIAVDSSGANVYFTDQADMNIKKLESNGTVSSIFNLSGSIGSVIVNSGSSLSVDSSGNLYVRGIDSTSPMIPIYYFIKIASDGNYSTIQINDSTASIGYSTPFVLGSDGNFYSSLVKVAPDGNTTAFFDINFSNINTIDSMTDDIANLWSAYAIARDGNGSLYNILRYEFKPAFYASAGLGVFKLLQDRNISFVAGSPTVGNTDGLGTLASFGALAGIVADSSGNLYVADGGGSDGSVVSPTYYSPSIRKIYVNGLSNLTPAPFSFAPVTDGTKGTEYNASTTISGLSAPTYISVTGGQYSINGGAFTSGTGAVKSGDTVTVKVIAPNTLIGSVSATLIVGTYSADFNATITYHPVLAPLVGSLSSMGQQVDGNASTAQFGGILGLFKDSSGYIYAIDNNQSSEATIRKISRDGSVATVGSIPVINGSLPMSASMDKNSTVYALYGCGPMDVNCSIYKISSNGTATYLASSSSAYLFGRFVVDPSGNLFVSSYDRPNPTIPGFFAGPIYKITPSGVVSSFSTVPATLLAIDSNGTLYATDVNITKIYKVASDGSYTVLAGSDTQGTSDGNGSAASFTTIVDMITDNSGNIYAIDTMGSMTFHIRKITAAGAVSTQSIDSSFEHDLMGSLTFDSDGNILSAGGTIVKKVYMTPPAFSLSDYSLAVAAGSTATITVSGATGSVRADIPSGSSTIATASVSGNTVTVTGVSGGTVNLLIRDDKYAFIETVTVSGTGSGATPTGGSVSGVTNPADNALANALGSISADQLNSLLTNIQNTGGSTDASSITGTVTSTANGGLAINLAPTTNTTGDTVSNNIIISKAGDTQMTIGIQNTSTAKSETISVALPSGVTLSKTAVGDIVQTLSVTGGTTVAVTASKSGEVTAAIKTASGETTKMTVANGATVTVTKDGTLTQTVTASDGSKTQITATKDGSVSTAVTTSTGQTSSVTTPPGASVAANKDGSVQTTVSTGSAQATVTSAPTGDTSAALKTSDGDTKSVSMPAGSQTTVSSSGVVQASAQLNTAEGSTSANLTVSPTTSPSADITVNQARSRGAGVVTIKYQPPANATGAALKIIASDVTQTTKSTRAKVASRLEASYNSRSDFSFTNSNSAQYIDPTKSVSMNIAPQGVASFTENKYFTGAEDIALSSGEANIDTTLTYGNSSRSTDSAALTRSVSMPLAEQVSLNGTGDMSLSNKAAIGGNQIDTIITTTNSGALSAIANLTQLGQTRDLSGRAKVVTTQVASYTARADFSSVNLQVLYDGATTTLLDGNTTQSAKSVRTYGSKDRNLRAVKIAGGKFVASYNARSEFSFIADSDLAVANDPTNTTQTPYSFASYSARALQNISITPQGAATFVETQTFDGTRAIKLTSGAATFSSDNLTAAMVLNMLYPLPNVSSTCQTCDKTQSVYVKLIRGWNLIANPISTPFTGLSNLKQRGVSKAWAFKGGAWVGDPATIEPGDGVWARFDGDNGSDTLSLDFEGISYKPDFSSLPSGWSLVGTGNTIQDLSSGYNLSRVYLYRNGIYIDTAASDAMPINPGEGFWVKKEIKVAIANGWNLLSVPVNQDFASPSVFGDTDYVYVYRNGAYQQNPSNLRVGEGVWVKNSKVDRTVTFEGQPYAPKLDSATSDSWTLLGTGQNIATFGLSPFYKIWVYRNNMWLNPTDNNLADVKAGEGVWVKRR